MPHAPPPAPGLDRQETRQVCGGAGAAACSEPPRPAKARILRDNIKCGPGTGSMRRRYGPLPWGIIQTIVQSVPSTLRAAPPPPSGHPASPRPTRRRLFPSSVVLPPSTPRAHAGTQAAAAGRDNIPPYISGPPSGETPAPPPPPAPAPPAPRCGRLPGAA